MGVAVTAVKPDSERPRAGGCPGPSRGG